MYLEDSSRSCECENKYLIREMDATKTDFNQNQNGMGRKNSGKSMEGDLISYPSRRKVEEEDSDLREEVLALRTKFPNKVPIIIKRFHKETELPNLEKSKYLVPQEITMCQFQTVIRNRIKLQPTQSLYLLVNNRSLMCLSLTLSEIYSKHASPDGFLYITYASQQAFGTNSFKTCYQ